jgi:hypothetical protein
MFHGLHDSRWWKWRQEVKSAPRPDCSSCCLASAGTLAYICASEFVTQFTLSNGMARVIPDQPRTPVAACNKSPSCDDRFEPGQPIVGGLRPWFFFTIL